tara:strand:- start:1129 stop:1857 length:729 start_codon:yes stop_codon:yes gene_type:complete
MNNHNNLEKKSYLGNNASLKILFKDILSKYEFNFEDDETVVFTDADFLNVMRIFQENDHIKFESLIDVIAVDYSDYGISEWNAKDANNKGYSRGIKKDSSGRYTYESTKTNYNQPIKRFAVIYNLLSVSSNARLKVKFYCNDDTNPSLPSATLIWASANWYEREAYDLLGIVFSDHPDLRRILTDYGFIGHPLRKDFPLIGNVEVNYDIEKERVVYQPVTIKPRVLIPKVIREVSNKEDKNA